jgi:hypothetical protein
MVERRLQRSCERLRRAFSDGIQGHHRPPFVEGGFYSILPESASASKSLSLSVSLSVSKILRDREDHRRRQRCSFWRDPRVPKKPSSSSFFAVSLPIPDEAPVNSTTFFSCVVFGIGTSFVLTGSNLRRSGRHFTSESRHFGFDSRQFDLRRSA